MVCEQREAFSRIPVGHIGFQRQQDFGLRGGRDVPADDPARVDVGDGGNTRETERHFDSNGRRNLSE